MEVKTQILHSDIPLLDAQHQKITNWFHLHCDTLPNPQELQVFFRMLVAHFLYEESILTDEFRGDPSLESHIKFHEGILSELDMLVNRPLSEGVYQSKYSLLVSWIKRHDTLDHKYLARLRSLSPEAKEILIQTRGLALKLIEIASHSPSDELYYSFGSLRKELAKQ